MNCQGKLCQKQLFFAVTQNLILNGNRNSGTVAKRDIKSINQHKNV